MGSAVEKLWVLRADSSEKGRFQSGKGKQLEQIHFFQNDSILPKPMYPAFPEWIPATCPLGAQDQPQACLPRLSNSSLFAQCQTAIYKAIFFVLDNSVGVPKSQK